MQIRKNNLKKIISNNYYLLFFLFLYLTVLLGFYFDEDNLGGAIADATSHFKTSEEFNKNFLYTLENFGESSGLVTRNSPVFWIFLSIFEKYFSYDIIRFFNTFILFATAVVFYKSLLLKFRDIQSYHLLILSSFIFLSPSLRSLAIWPYSLIWGLFFFLLSIYYYLKFEDHLNFNKSFIILSNVIFAAYLYPAFSVFYLFYFLQILKKIRKLDCFKLIFFSFLLSIPCIIYLLSKDLNTIFTTAQGVAEGVSFSKSLNISNKILIIGSIFLYLILPIINIKEIFLKVKKISFINIIFISIFFLANIYFFNFPHAHWGGGFFHKVSNILFENNYLFFFSAFFSILIIYILIDKRFNNYLLLIILILYNPQLTIYIKYFDPLIFIIFLTLFDFDFKKHFVNKSYNYYQFYGVIIFYYISVYSKKIFF